MCFGKIVLANDIPSILNLKLTKIHTDTKTSRRQNVSALKYFNAKIFQRQNVCAKPSWRKNVMALKRLGANMPVPKRLRQNGGGKTSAPKRYRPEK